MIGDYILFAIDEDNILEFAHSAIVVNWLITGLSLNYYRFGCMVHFVGLIRRLVGAAFLPADQLAGSEWNRWIDFIVAAAQLASRDW